MKSHIFAFILLSLMLFSLPLISAVAQAMNHKLIAEIVYASLAPLCHQLPSRSYFILGEKMGLCARCFGITSGIFAGSLAYLALNKKEKQIPIYWIALALSPLAVDGLTQLIGLRESTNNLRFATGIIFGVVIPFIMLPEIPFILKDLRRFFKRS